jgi:ribosomal protein S18 acetylase RimI-like enzyme
MMSSPSLSPDNMFSQVMGRPAYRLDLAGNNLPNATLLEPLREKGSFAYAKVDIDDLPAMRFLYAQGFDLVDTSTTFDKPFVPLVPISNTIRFATPDDAEGTVHIARTSFQYTRLHLDPQVPNEIADEFKALWAGNYFRGQRGQAMLVAEVDGQIAGFLQLLYKGDTMVIDLIAVGKDYQRRGIGRDMIAFAETFCPRHEKVMVSTQLMNIPSIRLYESIGFRFASSQHIFHYHNL